MGEDWIWLGVFCVGLGVLKFIQTALLDKFIEQIDAEIERRSHIRRIDHDAARHRLAELKRRSDRPPADR